MTPTTRMPATLAVDIGGANTKAAWLDGTSLRTVSRPFEVWRDREGLAAVLREIAADPADAVAITMTAELSDAFRTKREGVAFVLDAAEDAFGDPSVLTTAGELISVEAARARPWDVAAANWVATALAVAGEHPDALLIDVGSTTADVIPIAGGRIAASGRNDLERLLAGELVYTGVLRTNLAAIAPRVPVRGGWCPVASELFAISADVHLVLGHLEAYDCPTPDGRPATVEFARERIARLVCSDVEQLDEAEIDAIAAYLHGEQVRQIEEAARRAAPTAPVVAAGSGAFLAREVAARLGRAVAADARGAGGGARGTAGGKPVLTVVKVGGGIGDDALPGLCAALGELGRRHPLLVVPGGARLRRRRARRRPPLRPARGDRAPDGDPRHGAVRLAAERPDPGRRALHRPRRASAPDGRACCSPPALPLDELPASWDVTSDSIAAWVARPGRRRAPRAREGGRRPRGRRVLPTALEGARFETWVIGARPARLAELLERGRPRAPDRALLPWRHG